MKRFDELLQAIRDSQNELAMRLAMERYNDVRDFSQPICIIPHKNGELVVTNDAYSAPEYVSEKKKIIQTWVGVVEISEIQKNCRGPGQILLIGLNDFDNSNSITTIPSRLVNHSTYFCHPMIHPIHSTIGEA